MKWLSNLINPPPRRLSVTPDVKAPPGERVYHEYFVGSEATDAGVPWLAKIYGRAGVLAEERGFAPSDRDARVAAIAWVEATKPQFIVRSEP